MAVFLLIPDASRLAGVFVLHRTVPASSFARNWPQPWMPRAALAVKVLAVGWMLYAAVGGSLVRVAGATAVHRLAGLYAVDDFERDGKPVPLLFSDKTLWQRVAIDEYRDVAVVGVRTTDDAIVRYVAQVEGIDAAHGRLHLTPRGAAAAEAITLAYRTAAPDLLELSGRLEGRAIAVRLHRLETSDDLLMSRGFHLVSDAPYGR
jgi:hypothetical protein